MRRRAGLLLLLLSACGEGDRVCLNGPCRVPGRPSALCESYVACFYRTGGATGSLDSTYGRGGVCWSSGQPTEDACTAACGSALPSLILSFPDAGCTAPTN